MSCPWSGISVSQKHFPDRHFTNRLEWTLSRIDISISDTLQNEHFSKWTLCRRTIFYSFFFRRNCTFWKMLSRKLSFWSKCLIIRENIRSVFIRKSVFWGNVQLEKCPFRKLENVYLRNRKLQALKWILLWVYLIILAIGRMENMKRVEQLTTF